MFCGNCGARAITGALFCGACGTPVVPDGAGAPAGMGGAAFERAADPMAPVGIAPPATTYEDRGIARDLEEAAAWPLAPAPGVESGTSAPKRKRRILTRVIAAAVVVLAAGAIAARMVTITLLASHGSIADLLPATTAIYATVNLSPGGSQGDHLRAIEQAFSSQPAWESVRQQVDSLLNGTANGSGVTGGSGQPTWNQIMGLTNGQFAVAVTNASALTSAGGYPNQPIRDALVLIAGLKVQGTLSDIVSQHSLGSPTKVDTNNGADIYQISGGIFANGTAYATILNGYAVIGETEAALIPEIAVLRGHAPRLSDNPNYKAVTKQAGADGVAFAYADDAALVATLQANQQAEYNLMSTSQGVQGLNADLAMTQPYLGPLGISVTVQADGLALHAANLTAGSTLVSSGGAPSQGATALPANSLAYLSLHNLTALYGTEIDQLLRYGVMSQDTFDQTENQVAGAISLLDGEAAIGLLPLNLNALQSVNLNTYNGPVTTTGLPLVALIDVSQHPDALTTVRAWLDRTFYQYGENNAFYTSVTPHGNPLYVWSGGWGYAQIKNWLVLSPAIETAANSVEGVLYGGQGSLAAADPNLAPSQSGSGSQAVMAIEIQPIFQMLESQMPSMSYDAQRIYQSWEPWLAPLRSLKVTTGTGAGGTATTLDAVLTMAGGT